MREIKFRAKDIASNKWLYGDIRQHKDDTCIYEQGGYKGEQVKDVTVGQFTGLLDKKGKEIYEGDIIIADRYEVVEVIFDNGAFQIRYTLTDGSKHQIPFTSLLNCKYYVIGNIYDNPEMLKGGTV